MHILSPSPVRATSLLWQPRRAAWSLTLICKATYALAPGISSLANEQEYPNEDDTHWDDNPARSLSAASDLVPFKPSADILLVGHAFAPGKTPARSVLARLAVGQVDKTIEVFCDRWWTAVGAVREGTRFTKMPLLYERAAGGPGTVNPVGIRSNGPPDKNGLVPLPNLQPASLPVTSCGVAILPVGFGPIAPTWPGRIEKLGRHAVFWSHTGWHQAPLPENMDGAYFNVAPPDQQGDELRDDVTIVLQNLHREHARLETRLPGVRPRVMVERAGASPQEVKMRCDTLWIDTDREICTLTWRGTIELTHAKEVRRAVVTMVERERTSDRGAWAAKAAQPAAPVALPALAPPVTTPPAVPQEEIGETVVLLSPPTTPATPFVRPPTQSPMPAPAPPPLVTAPALVGAAPTDVGRAAPPPHLGGSVPLGPNARLGSVGEISSAAAGMQGILEAPRPALPAEPLQRPAPKLAVRHISRQSIELLWFDNAYVSRMREHPAWKVLLAERELLELDRKIERSMSGAESGPEEAEPQEKVDRRDVFEILARGEPIAPARVKDVLDGAVDEDGKFEPPLVLVAGDLKLTFDELESLKAAVAVVTPLLPAADKKLRDAVEAGAELLKSPWPESVRTLAERAVMQIRKALEETRRELSATYVDEHIERAVLQGRHYQRRTVLGQVWLRAFLHAGGSSQDALQVYLPESLARELPMFPEIKVRVIAEVRGKQDKYEAQTMALNAIGLGKGE